MTKHAENPGLFDCWDFSLLFILFFSLLFILFFILFFIPRGPE